ncbi:MAG: nitroreductase family protein [Eubacterium sp.]
MGRQPVKMVVIQDKATIAQLSKMNAKIMGADIDPFYGAPTVIVVLADKSVPTHYADGCLTMGNLMNAAHAVGVDSCWIHRATEEFESEEGKALLAKWGIGNMRESVIASLVTEAVIIRRQLQEKRT